MIPGNFHPGVTVQVIPNGIEPLVWRLGAWGRRWVLRRVVAQIIEAYGGVEKLPPLDLWIELAGRGTFRIADAKTGVCESAPRKE